MIELRLRSQISDEELDQKKGKIVTDADYNAVLTRDARVRKPDGRLLCVYRPGALSEELSEESYPTLHELRKNETRNRGAASGMQRTWKHAGGKRTSTPKAVASAVVGALDAKHSEPFCRLTVWTGRETEQYRTLWPLLEEVSRHFEENVPDRYAVQAKRAAQTHADWVIPGTPFTTLTVNNTYPTGVHTDKGDLDEGFSCLAVIRRGDYSGGRLVFPRYRLAVDLRDRDLLLMDAHEWHGNTNIEKHSEDAERISIVAYYRTNIAECDSFSAEERKRFEHREAKSAV